MAMRWSLKRAGKGSFGAARASVVNLGLAQLRPRSLRVSRSRCQLKPSLDAADTLIEAVQPARHARVLFFERAEARFHLAHVFFQPADIATDCAKMFESDVIEVPSHDRKIRPG
ncbi:MAG: hypothetical protein KGL11_05830 [Alphaproteobacteria bacterium]|nr:hypothetical protein [Alphaproteobacteria bacterium]